MLHPEPRAGERAEVERQHVYRDPDVPHRRPGKPEVRVPWRGQLRDIVTGMIADVVAKEPGIRPNSRRRHGDSIYATKINIVMSRTRSIPDCGPRSGLV